MYGLSQVVSRSYTYLLVWKWLILKMYKKRNLTVTRLEEVTAPGKEIVPPKTTNLDF